MTVWNDARKFVSLIYKITDTFPQRERFGLVDQIRRAAVSISLNIAEGSNKNSDPDFRRFLRMAQGSVNEVVTGLYLALDQKLVNQKQFDEAYESALILNAKLNALIKSISH